MACSMAECEGEERYQSRVIQLEKCCCCIPLDIGVKIIGFAELVVCLFVFLVSFTDLAREAVSSGPGDVLYLRYTALVDILLAIYLLYGVFSGKPHYAKVWCVVGLVHLFSSILVTIYRFIFNAQTESKTPTVYQLGEFFLSTGLDAYFVLVVFSYYRQSQCRQLHSSAPTHV